MAANMQSVASPLNTRSVKICPLLDVHIGGIPGAYNLSLGFKLIHCRQSIRRAVFQKITDMNLSIPGGWLRNRLCSHCIVWSPSKASEHATLSLISLVARCIPSMRMLGLFMILEGVEREGRIKLSFYQNGWGSPPKRPKVQGITFEYLLPYLSPEETWISTGAMQPFGRDWCECNTGDLRDFSTYLVAIANFSSETNKETRLLRALRSLHSAFFCNDWEMRFLRLMGTLECLLVTDEKVRSAIAERVTAYLGQDTISCVTVRKMKHLYDVSSNIRHGRKLGNLEPDLILELESIVRDVLKRIFDSGHQQIFCGSSKQIEHFFTSQS